MEHDFVDQITHQPFSQTSTKTYLCFVLEITWHVRSLLHWVFRQPGSRLNRVWRLLLFFFLRRAALRAVINVSSHLSRIGSPSMGCQKRKKSQVLLVNSNKLRGFFIRENKQHALISKGLDLFVSFYSILTSSTWFCEKFMGFIEDKMLLIDPITFSLDFWEIRGLI